VLLLTCREPANPTVVCCVFHRTSSACVVNTISAIGTSSLCTRRKSYSLRWFCCRLYVASMSTPGFHVCFQLILARSWVVFCLGDSIRYEKSYSSNGLPCAIRA